MSASDVGLKPAPKPSSVAPGSPAPPVTPPHADEGGGGPPGPEPKVHWIQRVMDNPWLLLALGLAIPLLSYTLWGWFELATLPPATLP